MEEKQEKREEKEKREEENKNYSLGKLEKDNRELAYCG